MAESHSVPTRPDLGHAVEPVHRARLLQAHLEAVDALPGDAGVRIRARLPAADVAAIQRAAKTTWISAELSERIGHATLTELGPEGYVDHYRRFASRISKTPLFDVLARGALRLFSFSPTGLLRTIPRAWSAVSRDVARLEIIEGDKQHASVRLYEIAPQCRSTAVVLSWKGSILGALDLLDCAATVEVDSDSLDDGVVLYHVTWA